VNREWAAQASCLRLVEERAAKGWVGITAARRSVWDLFFLGPNTPRVMSNRGRPPDWGPALAICAGCPVRAACLDWALTAPLDELIRRLEEQG
jgi:hypothetical protein